jgi:acetyltransferase-like isoleucine patch superfamily enzyme
MSGCRHDVAKEVSSRAWKSTRSDPLAFGAATISPLAEVDEGATVAEGSVVWQFTKIRTGSSIGKRCRIGAGVYVGASVAIGDDCKVENAAQVFEGAQLGSGVFIGPGALLLNDNYPRAVNPSGVLKQAADWTVKGVTVEDGASIGGAAVVLPGRHIGRFALVGAGAVVATSVPPHALVVGNPARRIGTVCECGTRVGDDYSCSACGLDFVFDPATGFPELSR